jgi:hypothetical protein
MQFPTVTAANLSRIERTFPADFAGELNIVFIAFEMWHQRQVDTWVPLARELEATVPGVRYYEFPVIWNMGWLRRTFINEGMRAGIPDPVARERTITLYLDKRAFRRALDMPDEKHIYALLLDGDGEVLWRERGELTDQKAAALKEAVAAHGG